MEEASHHLSSDRLEIFANAFGTALKQAREGRKWSIYRLSQESGVDERGIRRIEEGTTSPSVDTLLRLSLALGVRPSEVIEVAEAMATRAGLRFSEDLESQRGS